MTISIGMPALDRDSIAAVDSTGQTTVALGLADQLRDALARTEQFDAQPLDAPGGLVIAGMGGSAVGGRLALGALGPQLRRPLLVSDGYDLPGWVGPTTAVFCSSYSGGTEETLAAYADATRRGAQRLIASTGGALSEQARADGVPVFPLPAGLQPRAAVAYALVAALEAAGLAGVAPFVHEEIRAAADLVEQLTTEWGPDSPQDSYAKSIARAIHGTVPVIGGAELMIPAAYRWKCQFNENTEIPAFASALPEADHNEVVGWAAAAGLGQFSYVSLEDPEQRPANALRSRLTAELAATGAAQVVRIEALGETRLERLLSVILLGDLVSLYAAVLRGADPVDIPAIDALKAQLAG